jgi:hypothetical protein
MQMHKQQALDEIEQLMEEMQHRADQIAGIYRAEFPHTYRQGEAYGSFTVTHSSNRYDTTLTTLLNDAVQECEEYEEEEA